MNVGWEYRIGRIMCSLEGGSFQMYVNLDAQKQWAGLA